MTATTIGEKFIEANKESSVIQSDWLDGDKRMALGPPDTWKYLRLRLENGRLFIVPAEQIGEMIKAGVNPRWASHLI